MAAGAALLAALATLSLGCNNCGGAGGDASGPGDSGPGTDGPGMCTAATLAWAAPGVVAGDHAGNQNELRFDGAGNPHIFTWRDIEMMDQGCMWGGSTSNYDLLHLQGAAGVWTETVVDTVNIVNLNGIGFDFDPASGEPCVAYGGAVMGTFASLSCGAHDLLFTCRSGGAWAAPTAVIVDSATPDPCGTGGQNVCNVGDVTGLWPFLAATPTGGMAIAMRDQHFGWNKVDLYSADLEYAEGGAGGGWSVRTPWPAEGGGLYPSIAFDAAGEPLVVHEDFGAGVMLSRRAGGTWATTNLRPGNSNERINVAVDTLGTIWVAFTSISTTGTASTLTVMSSTDDGMTWATETADDNGRTGFYPSLRIASVNGEEFPVISFYRCADAGNDSCDAGQDALRVAYRSCGAWRTADVPGISDPLIFAGMYTSLALDPDGDPVVAYQDSFSNASGMLFRNLWLVEGTWE